MDAGNEGYSSILRQNDRIIGSVARAFKTKSQALQSASFRELTAIVESLVTFEPIVIGKDITIFTDSEITVKQASKAEQSIPLVSRLFDRIAHLPITWKWIPRESPDIVMVDQMGRGLRQDGEKIAEHRGA